MGSLKPTNVPYGRYVYKAPSMASPYNQFMGGTDVWDRMRLLHHYSLEKHIVCPKWWQKMFWGLFDACVANAFVCWRSVAPTKRTHIQFMHDLHQALVNNCFDETNSWGNKINPPPAVQVKVDKVFNTPTSKRARAVSRAVSTPTASGIILPAELHYLQTS